VKPPIPSSDAFWILSSAYRDAGDAVLDKVRAESYTGFAVLPCVFSYFRSIELGLKAVLTCFDVPEQEITRTLGHRISNLLEKTETLLALSEIGVLADDRKLLDHYSDDYSGKWFEYPDTFWDEYPNLEELKEIAHRVCDTIQHYKRKKRQHIK
jgi:hypothetical protein